MLFYLAKLLSNEAKNWPKGPNRTAYEKMIVFYWAKLLCNKAKNWQKRPKRRWLIKKSPWEDDSLYLMKPKMISSEVLPIHPHLLPYLPLKPPHFGVFGTGYSTHLLQSASILSFLVLHSVTFYHFWQYFNSNSISIPNSNSNFPAIFQNFPKVNKQTQFKISDDSVRVKQFVMSSF